MARLATRLVLAASAVVLADTLLWWGGSRLLASQTARWVAQVEAHGWIVSAGEQSGGGWPFEATRAIDRVAISGGERILPGGLTWSADRVVLRITLAHPLTLFLAAEGQQFLRLSHLPDLGFTAAHAVARLPLLPGHDAEGELDAAGISGGIAGSRHPQDVQVAALRLRLSEDHTAQAAQARLDLRAEAIGLPDIGRWPLGATVNLAAATLIVSSPTLPDRPAAIGNGETRAASQATAWRDGGGRLTVRDASLRWGPLTANGFVELGLDERLQPAGNGTVDVAGTGPALDAAAQGGLIPPGVALTAKAVLAVMPRAPGSDAVRLPFLLRDRTVSVGQIPVATLNEMTWDRSPP